MYLPAWNPVPRFARTLFLLAFLLAATTPDAATAEPAPWEGEAFAADPAAVLATAAQAPAGEEGVVILFAEARHGFDESGRQTVVRRKVYLIVNATADESWSALETSWSPWYQERPQLRARVITPDGKVHLLDPATITEAATAQEPTLFEDTRILRAPLPAASPGAVVEQEVTIRDTAPFFDRGTVSVHGIQSWVPVLHARLVLDAPAALPLRFAARRLPAVAPREESAEGRRRLTFEYRDLPAFEEPEPGLPPDQPRFSYVGFSTGSSWEEVARRYSELVDAAVANGGTEVLASFLRAAGGPAGSQRETIDRLLARMGSEVRYTAVELGEGGLVPRTPAETVGRKFGDCKDKAVLLTALLRSLDIPAYVALLRAGEEVPDVEESLPGMGGFNHAIVYVPATPPIWIDPTDRYARSGELPAGDQGRLALIASPTAKGLVRTPEATAADNREIETREVHLAGLGPARVVETTELHGVNESAMRALYATVDPKELRESLTSYVGGAYLAKDLAKLDFSDPADLSQPFRIHLEVAKAPRGTTDLQTAAVAVFPTGLAGRLPEAFAPAEGDDEPKPRKSDYYFTRPVSLETRYRIVPPPGFRPQPLPETRTRRFGPASLSEEYAAAADGVVTAVFRLEVGQRRLTPQEFEAVRSGVRGLVEEDAVLVTFEQVGEAHLAAGEVREALAELRRLAALAPKEALPHTRVARALLAGGLGEAARDEARRAVALEPTSAFAHSQLAWVLLHDEIGRQYGPGFDLAGAIAAYRKAKELDPQDGDVRWQLAILLEYNRQGERYGRGADLAAAIEEYKALQAADLDATTMPQNLPIALLRAGRFAEAKQEVAKLEEGELRNVLRLVAVAADDGSEAALREAERLLSDPGQRARTLAMVADNLVFLRRYAEAVTLLQRSSRNSPNAAQALARIDRLRKVRRYEEVTFAETEPAGVARRLLLLALQPEARPEEIKRLFRRDAFLDLEEDEAAFVRSVTDRLGVDERQPWRADEEQSPPSDVMRDIVLSGFEERVTDEGPAGHRVELTESQSGWRWTFSVVPEGGAYKIASVHTPASRGLEALRRLQSGDVSGARQCLDWARDRVKPAGGDDPLASPPFALLWTPGTEATADETRCAAAALLADRGQKKLAAKAAPLLLPCRDAAPAGTRRMAFDMALALAYGTEGRFAEQSDVLRQLAAAVPASETAAGRYRGALANLQRWAEVRTAAEERLAAYPSDMQPLRDLYEVAQHQGGGFEEAERQLQRIIDAGKASSWEYNNLAWLGLFREPFDERSIQHGQRAVTLSEYGDDSHLHTLATLYAEAGKTAEAYKLLLQALDQRGDPLPGADDWYVLGRLAEHYGLPEVARSYYDRVTAPEGPEPDPTSTHELARRRLATFAPAATPVAQR